MKKLVRIVMMVVACSVMVPIATHAVSLVETTRESSDITFTRQVTGVRGGEAVSTTPGGYPTQVRGDGGQFMNDGQWSMAFCIEPGQEAPLGGELRVQAISPEEQAGGLQAAWLMDNFYNAANSKVQLAALQIAVWEVITDTHGNYDLSAGDFKIWGGSQQALDIAYGYLVSVPTHFDVEYLNNKYLIATHPSEQDLIVQICDCL